MRDREAENKAGAEQCHNRRFETVHRFNISMRGGVRASSIHGHRRNRLPSSSGAAFASALRWLPIVAISTVRHVAVSFFHLDNFVSVISTGVIHRELGV